MNFQELIVELAKVHSTKAAAALVGAFLFAQVLPVASLLAVGIFLVVCDWVTGVWSAIKRNEKITSKGLRRTVEKIVMYSLSIIIVLAVEIVFFNSHVLVVGVALYISLVELFSNLENISSITGTNILAVVKDAIMDKFPAMRRLFDKKKPPADG